MKNLIVTLILLASVTWIKSNDFVSHIIWYSNYQEAFAISQQEKKVILMVFSGSDWCQPCIKLKKLVFENEDFMHFAEDKLVLLEVDFPRKRKNKQEKEQITHNESLAEKYNPDGIFPKVLLLKDNKVLGELKTKDQVPNSLINDIQQILSIQ